MKKIITIIATILTAFNADGQPYTVTADFENFSLNPNSAYSPSASIPFQTQNAIFKYQWSTTYTLWTGGFAYTNVQDSTNGTYTNLYGVKAFKGYNNSSKFAIGQDKGAISIILSNFCTISGFYITNTTYAYKTIKNGNQFARKFGDTTGTHSGNIIPQGSYPDFFKITARGFSGGSMKSDSAVFYLADYRFSNNTLDYIVKTWQWFDLSKLGTVDSLKFFMYSSDNSFGFMNTPGFFAMDDFTNINTYNSLNEINSNIEMSIYPNPVNNKLTIQFLKGYIEKEIYLSNILGEEIFYAKSDQDSLDIETQNFLQGIYFLRIKTEKGDFVTKIIKE